MLAPNFPIKISDHQQSALSFDLLKGPLKDNFSRITRLTKKLFDVPISAISFVNDQSSAFKSLLDEEIIETPRDISFCGHVINQEDILNIPETFSDDRFRNNPLVLDDPHVRFYAGCPVQINRQKLGTICIADHQPRYFTPPQLNWLKDVAALVETEIQNYTIKTDKGKLASDLDQARLASMVDPLTSLWNRQGIYNILKHQMDGYLSKGNAFSVAILDIDNFKAINDTFGHDAGDYTLQAIAQSLIKGCRETDAIGRWGGEEFLLLINETKRKNVLDITQRIRSTIESQQIKMPCGISRNITVTIGVTGIEPTTTPSLKELINKADQALYQGKGMGRNQVVMI